MLADADDTLILLIYGMSACSQHSDERFTVDCCLSTALSSSSSSSCSSLLTRRLSHCQDYRYLGSSSEKKRQNRSDVGVAKEALSGWLPRERTFIMLNNGQALRLPASFALNRQFSTNTTPWIRFIKNNKKKNMKGVRAVFWLSLVSSPWQTLSQAGAGYLGGIGYVYYDCSEGTETNDCLMNGGICSDDGVCLPKTCENVYRYAIYSRSRDNGAQQQEATLQCYVNEFPPNNVVKPPCGGDGVFPMAVYYTCADELWSNGIQLPCPRLEFYGDQGLPPTPLFVSMNRVCTAKPSPKERFICYDIAPDTDLTSYFDDYLAAVEPYARCKEDESGAGGNVNNMTNTTWYGHTIVAGDVWITGPDMGSTFFANLYMGDNFDPVGVAASAFATVLIDNSSSLSTYGTDLFSSIIVAILLVSMMVIIE